MKKLKPDTMLQFKAQVKALTLLCMFNFPKVMFLAIWQHVLAYNFRSFNSPSFEYSTLRYMP